MTLLILAGCTSKPPSSSTVPPSTGPSPVSLPAAGSTVAPVGASTAPGGCAQTPLWTSAYPEWTASANLPGTMPYALSHEGNLVGMEFAGSLRGGTNLGSPTNKILWVTREARNSQPLHLTLRRVDGTGAPVTQVEPANSGPGEIYPSIVDVPTSGCWRVEASWDGHAATLELYYT